MTCERKRSGFQITSVTSEIFSPIRTSPSTPGVVLTAIRSKTPFPGGRGSSSQPSTPSSKRRHISNQGTGAPSRFRLVRLAGGGAGVRGRGDTYGRGRWTCTEFKEGRVVDGVRNALSLESLESIGGAARLVSQTVETGEPPVGSSPSDSAARPQKQVVSISAQLAPRHADLVGPERRLRFTARHQVALANHKVVGSPSNSISSVHSAAAIDNKIERAMDLAKSHLMLAVREEVELLREQIRELQDRNQQLEAENRHLREQTHSDPDLSPPTVSPSG
ncbi:TSC22 domain family protein 4-like isoform X1 [Stigmatopora nigra]